MKQIYDNQKQIFKLNKQSNNIAFILNDNYVKYLSVTLAQIKKYCSKELTILLLYDKLSNKNIKKISKYCLKIKFDIEFIDISNYKLIDLDDGRAEYWFSSMAKKILLTSDFFKSIGPILYLDIDISIIGSIDELFDLNKKSIYGVIELASITYKAKQFILPEKIIPEKVMSNLGNVINLEQYFRYINVNNYVNAGVLIINPKFCKNRIPFNKVIEYVYSDQDYINKNFDSQLKIIDYKFNLSASFLYRKNNLNDLNNFISPEQFYLFNNSINDMRIVHYAGYIKPWNRFIFTFEKWDFEWFISIFRTNFKFQILLSFMQIQIKSICQKMYSLLKKIFKYTRK